MSEINTLTVNGKAYELADAYAREQAQVLMENTTGVVFCPNLLPEDYYDPDHKELYGITYGKQADGTIVATGTATNSARYEVTVAYPIKAGTYTISGCPGESASGRLLKYRIGGSGSYQYFRSGSRTFTVEEATVLDIRIEYQAGYAISGQDVWGIMLEKGAVAHPYVKPGTVFDGMQKTLALHATQIADIQAALEGNTQPEDTNGLPAYYTDYMTQRLEAINEKDCLIGGHGDSFVFITDTHLERNKLNSPALIKEIINNTAVRFVINGGDTLDNDPTQGEALARLRQWRRLMHGVEEYRVKGNHDLNGSGQSVAEAKLTEDHWYGTMVKPFAHLVKTGGKSYFCIDNQNAKIRYICLGAPYSTAEQRAWLKARLTELEAGWSVLVIPHYLFDSTTDVIHTHGQYLINDINDVYVNMNATLIGVLAGHTHTDYATTEAVNGYHLIATTCDALTGTPAKTAGTVTEQAFDVIHIDTATRMLYATRIGAGEDRQWSY